MPCHHGCLASAWLGDFATKMQERRVIHNTAGLLQIIKQLDLTFPDFKKMPGFDPVLFLPRPEGGTVEGQRKGRPKSR
jgi:hypothetical protein